MRPRISPGCARRAPRCVASIQPSRKRHTLPSFETTRRVPFTARQMFDVVADVERYPQFLPLCEGLVVRSREAKGAETVLVATMTVGYRAIRESFTSRVTVSLSSVHSG